MKLDIPIEVTPLDNTLTVSLPVLVRIGETETLKTITWNWADFPALDKREKLEPVARMTVPGAVEVINRNGLRGFHNWRQTDDQLRVHSPACTAYLTNFEAIAVGEKLEAMATTRDQES